MTEETKKTISRDEMFARLDMAKTLWPGAKADGTTAALASEAMSWIMDGRELEGSRGCGCKDKKPKPQERADLLASQLQELVKNAIKVSGNLTVRDYIAKGNPALSKSEQDFISGVLYVHGLRECMPEDALHKWIMNDK
jgi:hypothetical protein